MIGDIKQVFPETIKVKTTSAKLELMNESSSSSKPSKKKGKSVVNEESDESVDEKISRVKQGLMFERIDNFNVEPYLVGIAIKP